MAATWKNKRCEKGASNKIKDRKETQTIATDQETKHISYRYTHLQS